MIWKFFSIVECRDRVESVKLQPDLLISLVYPNFQTQTGFVKCKVMDRGEIFWMDRSNILVQYSAEGLVKGQKKTLHVYFYFNLHGVIVMAGIGNL